MNHELVEWKARFAAQRKTAAMPPPTSSLRMPSTTGHAATGKRIAVMRRRLRETMKKTVVPMPLRPRIAAYDKALGTAMRLAATMPSEAVLEACSEGNSTGCTLEQLVALAYSALAIGRHADGLSMLAGIGGMLGGMPRAAFETALGLLSIDRHADARALLEDAARGLSDSEGFVHALLAQLHHEANDPRWIDAARHVIAVGTDIVARNRCRELLATARLH